MATKVLVVDNNVSLAEILQQMLVDEGFEVSAATDGREGYSAYLVNRPDVILTDIHMPGENGLEFISHIRRHNPEVRTIYMSGDWIRFQSAIEEEEKRFCVRLLKKPFSEDELMQLLAECLNSSEMRVSQEAGFQEREGFNSSALVTESDFYFPQ
jgi:DNA-binding NtrC family response regulator